MFAFEGPWVPRTRSSSGSRMSSHAVFGPSCKNPASASFSGSARVYRRSSGVEALRGAIRVNLSMGLVLLSLAAEVVFIALVGYGLYRAVDLVP